MATQWSLVQLSKMGLCLLKWTQLEERKKKFFSSLPQKSRKMTEPKYENIASLVLLPFTTGHSLAEKIAASKPWAPISSSKSYEMETICCFKSSNRRSRNELHWPDWPDWQCVANNDQIRGQIAIDLSHQRPLWNCGWRLTWPGH